jgi:mannose-6-phosphate isomerase-like protein (cupin superfamily)
MHIRRVVTGQRADGRSVFVSDQQVEPVAIGGLEFHRLWGSDALVHLPTDGTDAQPRLYFPPAGGFRFAFFSLPPASAPRPSPANVITEMQAKLPGLADVLERDNPGMHTTDTVDFDVVISGEVWLELDDGAEVRLGPGDCVVQNGTRHAWRNKSDKPCLIAVALVGAQRTSIAH